MRPDTAQLLEGAELHHGVGHVVGEGGPQADVEAGYAPGAADRAACAGRAVGALVSRTVWLAAGGWRGGGLGLTQRGKRAVVELQLDPRLDHGDRNPHARRHLRHMAAARRCAEVGVGGPGRLARTAPVTTPASGAAGVWARACFESS